MMNDEFYAFLFGVFVAVLITGSLFRLKNTEDKRIESGKEFIIWNSSYKCTKTNQLLKERK